MSAEAWAYGVLSARLKEGLERGRAVEEVLARIAELEARVSALEAAVMTLAQAVMGAAAQTGEAK